MVRKSSVPLVCALSLVICAVVLADGPAKGSAKEEKSKAGFLRLVRDKNRVPIAMETAIVRCVPQDCGRTGPTVDLIAAVHVADKGYYALLNEAFTKYDAVLYELVAPEGTRIPKGGSSKTRHPVSGIQKLMSDVLELQFQLEAVDYTRNNMVHADMSPEQFARSMKSRGESVWTLLFRMMGYAMARQSNDASGMSDARLLLALFDRNRALALKRIMAEQFEDLEGSLIALEGPDGSTLISERNKVALEVLRKQIASGKKNLAIFYGGGHMPDFETRLRDDFGLVRLSERWLPAWDMKDKRKPATSKTSQREPASKAVPNVIGD